MPALLKVLSVVLPVFFIIGLGYVFAIFKRISLAPVIEILLYLTVPALVIATLTHKKILPGELAITSLSATGVVLGCGLISFIYLSIIKRRELRGFYLPTMFMNSGNLSFPIALLAFGMDGLAVAVLYYIAVSILVYSLGIYIAKEKEGVSEIFKLPLIYSSVIGIAINLLGIKLPTQVLTTLEMLGAPTIPLMQVSLGYHLYHTKLSDINISLAGSLIRILGGLIIAYAIVTAFGIDGLTKKIILLSSCMPSAVISFIMSRRYDVQSDLVASTVAMSTIISIVTIPALLMWIM